MRARVRSSVPISLCMRSDDACLCRPTYWTSSPPRICLFDGHCAPNPQPRCSVFQHNSAISFSDRSIVFPLLGWHLVPSQWIVGWKWIASGPGFLPSEPVRSCEIVRFISSFYLLSSSDYSICSISQSYKTVCFEIDLPNFWLISLVLMTSKSRISVPKPPGGHFKKGANCTDSNGLKVEQQQLSERMTKSATFHDFCEAEEDLEDHSCSIQCNGSARPVENGDELDACQTEPISSGRSGRRANRLESFANWLQRFSIKRRHTVSQRTLIRPSVSLCRQLPLYSWPFLPHTFRVIFPSTIFYYDECSLAKVFVYIVDYDVDLCFKFGLEKDWWA